MIFYAFRKINGSLAQLVEQLTLNQWAKSSSLLRSTIVQIKSLGNQGFFCFTSKGNPYVLFKVAFTIFSYLSRFFLSI